MRKLISMVMFLGLMCFSLSTLAQTQAVTGNVTDANGDAVAGATVRVPGTQIGAITNVDGNFRIDVPDGTDAVVVSFIGMEAQTINLDGGPVSVALSSDSELLDEVVVTALGITRDKKSLGYATQKIGGDDIADVKSANFADALSGEVAGLDIQSFNQLGGSANIVTRGYSSLTGNNQALIVIDGAPVTNTTSNGSSQRTGRGGYDYGNAATDINPDDIESVNVLKGAAATALYGSRASNGAIIITTKSGKKGKGLGVALSSSAMIGTADESTLPKYQNKYGGGYGPYYSGPGNVWDVADVDGDGNDDLVALAGEDASYGAAFDPNLMVYNWYNLIPGYGNYLQPEAWVAPNSTPNDFLKSSNTFNNSFSLSGGGEDTDFRLSYTNLSQTGILPNSELDRNTVSLKGSHNFSDKLNAGATVTYTKTDGLGRYGTGYSNRNTFQSFRQWYQMNADIDKQRDVFEKTGQNYSWNMNAYNGGDFFSPHYTDNAFWMRENAFNTDTRDRYIGNVNLNYELFEGINILGRVAFDSYDELRKERINVGSIDVSNYTSFDQNVAERNYDLMASFTRELSADVDLDGLVGWNLRVENRDFLDQSTNGGLITPGLYTFDNSVNAITPADVTLYDATKKVDGYYGRISAGFLDTYFLEGTGRVDRSSALPVDNNRYFYPSVSGSVILSNLIEQPWLNFAKLRGNYAEVGSDTGPYSVFNTYGINPSFGGGASATNPSTFANANLKPERHKELEFGVETRLFNNRLGLDVSVYNRKTEDLITNVDVSTSSGASQLLLNGGSLENKGVEIFTNITPIETDDFSWDVKVNFTKNKSEVLELAEGISFLQLGSVQGGVTLGAAVGEPFGVIRGRDFIYHDNGGKVVYTAADAPSGSWVGKYARTAASNVVIGDINPDWTGGVKNNIRYKNFDLGFLIDVQKGGDVFSLDTWYGYATGLYDFTAADNDLGNPVRNSLADGGGVILDGVNADGSTNTTRADASTFLNPWGYARNPNAAHVYDAGFVKLREVKFGYSFPSEFLSGLNVQDASLSLISRNPWIISKNTPYTDPEAGLSAGNVQGNQSGAYPSVREVGVSLNVKF